MSSEVAIKVENLSKCYQIYDQPGDRLRQFVMPRFQRACGRQPRQYFREFWALKNISIEVKRGETVGIIGRNGSGKSTLLQMICGTLNPTQGSIQTHGRIAALLELGSGFNPEFSGRENVYMNGAVLGLSKEEIDSRFDSIVEFAEIGDFIEQPVKIYSSGMLVRLAFAVAINVDPEILIVDEALSVGDELFQRKCFSRIDAIREAGATILFVSHSGTQVVELCDRVILLDAGEFLASGVPKQMVGRYQKLLYAPDEARADIRAEIRLAALPAQHTESAEVFDLSTNSGLDAVVSSAQPACELGESFDPLLKPSSTIAYDSHGAWIENPAIYTVDGEPVNNLIRGRSYLYRYRVRFEKSVSHVRFGMLIKTTTGFELGGGTTASSVRSSLPIIAKGALVDVEFKFECRLNPGVYFLNAGVVGCLGDNETFLHRLIDIAMFRVLTESENHSNGLIDFTIVSCVSEVLQ
jgi:lipopolysaccharide transport system ATP-binding protein